MPFPPISLFKKLQTEKQVSFWDGTFHSETPVRLSDSNLVLSEGGQGVEAALARIGSNPEVALNIGAARCWHEEMVQPEGWRMNLRAHGQQIASIGGRNGWLHREKTPAGSKQGRPERKGRET